MISINGWLTALEIDVIKKTMMDENAKNNVGGVTLIKMRLRKKNLGT